MVTTSRLVPLDVVGRAEQDLIHLTGPLQVVARAEMDKAGDAAAQVDLRFDPSRIRGVSLKSGVRYWVEGLHCSSHQTGNEREPFELMGRFDLMGGAPRSEPPTRLILTVRLRVVVPADGRVTVEASDVGLLPDDGTGSSPPTTGTQKVAP